METVIVTHQVKDYDTWKAGFDADVDRRAGMGITNIITGKIPGSPDQAILIITLPSFAKLAGVMQDPELMAKMAELGVMGPPTIQLLTSSESVAV